MNLPFFRGGTVPAFLTLKQFCKRYAISERAALKMIANKELPAINLATAGTKSHKPRWRIRVSDLDAFEAGRTVKPAEPEVIPVRKPARQKQESRAVTFFKNGVRVRD